MNTPLRAEENHLNQLRLTLKRNLKIIFEIEKQKVDNFKELLVAYNPNNVLKRGYSLVKKDGKVIKIETLKVSDVITVSTHHSNLEARILAINNIGRD